MESKNMAAESTRTSTEIKEQYEKHKKVCWRDFLFFLQKGKMKAMKTEEMRKKVKKNGKSGKRKDE